MQSNTRLTSSTKANHLPFSHLLLSISTLFILATSLESSENTDNSIQKTPHTITYKYAPNAVLNKKQEQIVISLAKKNGIKNISQISTRPLPPSTNHIITIFGKESITGRHVTQPILHINFAGKNKLANAQKKENIKTEEFRAGKVINRKTTILIVDKKEYRLNLVKGLEIKKAESLLKQLQLGNFNSNSATNINLLDIINWQKPTSLHKTPTKIYSSFKGINEHEDLSLTAKIVNNKLVIDEISCRTP